MNIIWFFFLKHILGADNESVVKGNVVKVFYDRDINRVNAFKLMNGQIQPLDVKISIEETVESQEMWSNIFWDPYLVKPRQYSVYCESMDKLIEAGRTIINFIDKNDTTLFCVEFDAATYGGSENDIFIYKGPYKSSNGTKIVFTIEEDENSDVIVVLSDNKTNKFVLDKSFEYTKILRKLVTILNNERKKFNGPSEEFIAFCETHKFSDFQLEYLGRMCFMYCCKVYCLLTEYERSFDITDFFSDKSEESVFSLNYDILKYSVEQEKFEQQAEYIFKNIAPEIKNDKIQFKSFLESFKPIAEMGLKQLKSLYEEIKPDFKALKELRVIKKDMRDDLPRNFSKVQMELLPIGELAHYKTFLDAHSNDLLEYCELVISTLDQKRNKYVCYEEDEIENFKDMLEQNYKHLHLLKVMKEVLTEKAQVRVILFFKWKPFRELKLSKIYKMYSKINYIPKHKMFVVMMLLAMTHRVANPSSICLFI